jgi:hypothetical protein
VRSLAELLATGQRQTLECFFLRLKKVSEPTVVHQKLLYNGSVLAHYARVSTHSAVALATPATLGEVFEHLVFDTSLRNDGAIMEAAGAQCLLLAGFFRTRCAADTTSAGTPVWARDSSARQPLWKGRRRKQVC